MRIATRRGSIIACSVSLDMHSEVFAGDNLWFQAPRFVVAVTRLLPEAGSPRVNDDHEADDYDLVRRSSTSLHRVSPEVLACTTNHVGGWLSLGMHPSWHGSRGKPSDRTFLVLVTAMGCKLDRTCSTTSKVCTEGSSTLNDLDVVLWPILDHLCIILIACKRRQRFPLLPLPLLILTLPFPLSLISTSPKSSLFIVSFTILRGYI